MTTNSYSQINSKIVELIVGDIYESPYSFRADSMETIQKRMGNSLLGQRMVDAMIAFDSKKILLNCKLYDLKLNDEDKFNLFLTLSEKDYVKFIIAEEVISKKNLDYTVCTNFAKLYVQAHKLISGE